MQIPEPPKQLPCTYKRQSHPALPFDWQCRRCKFGGDESGAVGGAGPDDLSQVRLLVISDYPGHLELQAGYPFVAQAPVYKADRRRKLRLRWANAGAALRYALGELGLNGYTDCWLTNALKCNPRADTGKVKENELDPCSKAWLHQEVWTLHELHPKLPIWLAGSQALKAFQRTFKWQNKGSINDLRRRVHWWLDHPVVVTWNPAAYCRSEFRQAGCHDNPQQVYPLFSEPLPLSPWEVYQRDWELLRPYLNENYAA